MTQYIFAQPDTFDISITMAIYDNYQQVARRTFPLRNLQGDTAAAQVEHAAAIMNEVAGELHYITHFGIDKGTIKLNGKKASELIYKQYPPSEMARYFRYGIKINFRPVYGYFWTQGNRRAFRISADQNDGSWQRECLQRHKTVTFNLPCMPASNQNPHEHFLRYSDEIKRRRKVIGWSCQYNHKDEVYLRFINRFLEGGNLAIGEKRYWGAEIPILYSKGIFWKPPQFKPQKAPRRSSLANAPVDDTEYVYLIRMGRTKFYKIGKSNDPNGRLISMQTASPHKLKLLHTFKADNATAAEEALHAALHHHRQEGEWFKLTDEQRDTITSITAYSSNHAIIAGQSHKISTLFN